MLRIDSSTIFCGNPGTVYNDYPRRCHICGFHILSSYCLERIHPEQALPGLREEPKNLEFCRGQIIFVNRKVNSNRPLTKNSFCRRRFLLAPFLCPDVFYVFLIKLSLYKTNAKIVYLFLSSKRCVISYQQYFIHPVN